MRKTVLLLILSCFVFFNDVLATHIAGGELFYEYLGPGSSTGTSRYKVTMRLFKQCNPPPSPNPIQDLATENVIVAVYDKTDRSLVTSFGLTREGGTPLPRIALPPKIPCISGTVDVCYQIGIFSAEVELLDIKEGYILDWPRYSRPNSVNISRTSGASFSTNIPGTDELTGHNSSPQFVVKDTALVCRNNNFVLDFGATDKDGDSLSYEFCDAFDGGGLSAFNPNQSPGPAQTLNHILLDYVSPYSGQQPLGPNAAIDPKTGIISGIAPSTTGGYVVNVCVTEWRNGKAINLHRKDFILRVENCGLTQADLPAKTLSCDGFNVTFENQSPASDVLAYSWDFGLISATTDTSSEPRPNFTFPDTGIYKVKLIVYGKEGCVDSGSTDVYVFPGFKADFNNVGSCFQTPIQFNDASTTKYGVVDSWYWTFGDLTTTADTSLIQNPTYKYPAADSPMVSLVVTNSKGCIDTIAKQIVVNAQPTVNLPFKDTLICSIDTLQLIANSTATVSWQPNNSNIIQNPTSLTPYVFPKSTTLFIATFTEDGCVSTDSVQVNVINDVLLDLGPDTTICLTDSVQFSPQTNALYFAWSPAATITDTTVKNAVATPLVTNTSYHLVASVGKCNNSDDINVYAPPYPQARAFGDTSICYGDNAQLSGITQGDNFAWTPPVALRNPATLTPIAYPSGTTAYILTAYNNIGCLKPVSDTVIVTVIPPVQAFAGRDTMIVINQPLQLNATGGNTYAWTPNYGMNNPNIADPVVTLSSFYDTVYYKVHVSINPPGCFADDIVKVIVFKTLPDIFIPTAFTPNSDGKNDILKPTVVGMQRFNYFRVFNRWGQMVYSTSAIGQGWNGIFAGQPQASGTYVFMAQAVDYLGNVINRKGTAVLIR